MEAPLNLLAVMAKYVRQYGLQETNLYVPTPSGVDFRSFDGSSLSTGTKEAEQKFTQ